MGSHGYGCWGLGRFWFGVFGLGIRRPCVGLGFRVEKVESLVRLKDRGGGSAVEDLRSGAMLPAYRKMWGKASGVLRLARVGGSA